MKTAIVLLLLMVAGVAQAKSNPQDLAQMVAYADNAILDAAQTGHKKVTLVFGNADPDKVEQVAAILRERGYRLDEEAALLNGDMIKVRGLKNSAVASR